MEISPLKFPLKCGSSLDWVALHSHENGLVSESSHQVEDAFRYLQTPQSSHVLPPCLLPLHYHPSCSPGEKTFFWKVSGKTCGFEERIQ